MKSLINSLNENFKIDIDEDNTTTSVPPVYNHDDEYDNKIDEIYSRLVSEVTYNDFKTSQGSSDKQKINNHIKEINKRLLEVEQMLNHAGKLKNETNSGNDVFWKSTFGKFQKIDQRLNRLSNKIREINS